MGSYAACAEGFAKFILKITNQSRMDKDSGVEYANYLGQLSPKFESINSEQINQLFRKIYEFQEGMHRFVVDKRNEISRNLGNSSSLDLGCVEKLKITQDLLKMNSKRLIAISEILRDNDSSLKQSGPLDASIKEVCGLILKIWKESYEACFELKLVDLNGIPKSLDKMDLNISVINRHKSEFDSLLEEVI